MRVSGTDAVITPFKAGNEQQPAPAASKKTTQESTRQNRGNDPGYAINEKVVSEAVGRLNKALEGSSRRFEYSVHKGTNEIMIKVIDDSTKEVIREIPSEKILDMIARMMEMAGLLVDERR